MVNYYDCDINDLIIQVSEELKKMKEIAPPEWASFVKTGAHKERAPDNPDWWYMRSASVLRKIAILGPIGISKLRTKYGGKKDRGTKPEHFAKGSGSIARKVLQQLEKAGLVKKQEKGRKGRVIAPKGVSLLDKVAVGLSKKRDKVKFTTPKPAPKPIEKKPETKPQPAPEKPKAQGVKPQPKSEAGKAKPEPKPEGKPAEPKPAKPEEKPQIKNPDTK